MLSRQTPSPFVCALDSEWSIYPEESTLKSRNTNSVLSLHHSAKKLTLLLPVEGGKISALTLKRIDSHQAILITVSRTEIVSHHIALNEEDFSIDSEPIEQMANLSNASKVHVVLNHDNTLISLVLDSFIWVLNLFKKMKRYQIVGHESSVVLTRFVVLNGSEVLISLGSDCSFKGDIFSLNLQ